MVALYNTSTSMALKNGTLTNYDLLFPVVFHSYFLYSE